MNTKRSTRNPSLPMVEAVSAMYTSMPWITDMTAISVVVERIMPSSVRKLRSLLDRKRIERHRSGFKKGCLGTASTFRIRDLAGLLFSKFLRATRSPAVQPESGTAARNEPDVAAVVHGDQPQATVVREKRGDRRPRTGPADRPWPSPTAPERGSFRRTDSRIGCDSSSPPCRSRTTARCSNCRNRKWCGPWADARVVYISGAWPLADADLLLEPSEEPIRVKIILRFPQRVGAGRQIDRRRNGADAGQQIAA